MEKYEKLLIQIGLVGVFIALGKVFISDEKLSLTAFLGRLIIGTGFSMTAGVVLMLIPTIHDLALIGLSAGLGIAGQNGLEIWVMKRRAKQ